MLEMILFGLLAAAPAPGVEPPAAPSDLAPTTDAGREAFLLKGKIGKSKGIKGGVTATTRASLLVDPFEHAAHIQCIDEYKASMSLSSGTELDFRDSYRNNVAAYRLDRMLGLGMVPVTVVRTYDRKPCAFTWWVDDVMMDEKKHYQEKVAAPDPAAWNHQIWVVRVFDQLIYNMDRNLGNLLIGKDWRVTMIDHSRAFKVFPELKNQKELGDHCERKLLAALRKLDAGKIKTELKDLLNPGQMQGLMGRRDRIVAYFDAKIAAVGEEQALYDLDTTFNGTTGTPP